MGYLDTPIEYIKGVGPQRALLLRQELNIRVYRDLIHHYPYKYVDRTHWHKIKDLVPELAYVQVMGRVVHKSVIGIKSSRRLTALLEDETGCIALIWFQSIAWQDKNIIVGSDYVVFGKLTAFHSRLSIVHPELERSDTASAGMLSAIYPVYPSTEKLKKVSLDSRGLLRMQRVVLDKMPASLEMETLPPNLLKDNNFCSKVTAVKNIHFPQTVTDLTEASKRLKFEELFFIQLGIIKMRIQRIEKDQGFIFKKLGPYFNDFLAERMPFELTGTQKRVLKEIRADTLTGRQMNRLLQGDVGSGKTIVAIIAMLFALDNGYQACLMVPTEILASQHFQTLTALMQPMHIQTGILTGSITKIQRKSILEKLASGELQIIVGTHALLEETVQFANLGMVVIDEQHRFGVAQRFRLWKKNNVLPHVLIMTATPIPRTLAMTLYGDLDVSVIDELPKGRKPISTFHFTESGRLKLFGLMKREIEKGRQVYVVYPLIEGSEKLDYLDLTRGVELLERAFPKPAYQIGILHGRMKPSVKAFEMQRFQKGETNILVSTTVIEVGVNVPNASVMIIENSERFGLATLHQLRGRVGRGSDQSFCFLMSSDKLSNDGKRRLEAIVNTQNGFEIAEADLRLRGPGALEGTQQSGVPGLKLADLVKDQALLMRARDQAKKILDGDPRLESPSNQLLKEHFQKDAGIPAWEKVS